MNGGMRSCFRMCSNSILSELKQNFQPEMAKQQLYSTFGRTISPKLIVVNNFKSTLERSSSFLSQHIVTENISQSSSVEKKLLEHVEQEIVKEKEKEKENSKVCGFDKKEDNSVLIFSKSLPNETITVKFNTNHYVSVHDYKEPTDDETSNDEPFKYKIKPNFRVEITREDTTLGFECILIQNPKIENHIQGDRPDDDSKADSDTDYYSDCYSDSDDDVIAATSDNDEKSSPELHQNQDTDMFIIRKYALYDGKLKENNYECFGVGNVRDAAMYPLMENLLREKGICNEFLREVIHLGEIRETVDHRKFLEKLKEFVTHKSSVWSSKGCLKAKPVSSKSSASTAQQTYPFDNGLIETLKRKINETQKEMESFSCMSKIDDFEVKLDGSEVFLIKSLPDEIITIHFNVNHFISIQNYKKSRCDNDDEISNTRSYGYKPPKSYPDIEIDVKRGDTILRFACGVYDNFRNSDGDFVFYIEEFALFNGELNESDYQYKFDSDDKYLKDSLIDFLKQKGIDSKFVSKIIKFSADHEHKCHLHSLEDLKKFTLHQKVQPTPST